MSKTVIFGGSFDPPHIGHIATVGYLRCRGYEVIVIPSIGHPFKNNVATFDQRLDMCNKAFSWMSGVKVSDIEMDIKTIKDTQDLSSGNYVYTIDVIRYLEAFDIANPILAIGEDLLDKRQLPKWYKFDELCKLVTFLVVPRHVDDLSSDYWIPPETCKVDYLGSTSRGIILPTVSSTDIRLGISSSSSLLDNPKSYLVELISEDVLQYIKSNKLYGYKAS